VQPRRANSLGRSTASDAVEWVSERLLDLGFLLAPVKRPPVSSVVVRPMREAYARGVVAYGEIEIIGGIELRDGDRFVTLRDELRKLLWLVIQGETTNAAQSSEESLTIAVERHIKRVWPDRAYFVEVGNDAEGWIQLFQPYGVPRNAME
jgi:hypothetical protein